MLFLEKQLVHVRLFLKMRAIDKWKMKGAY
jgi:hypothetical protein